MAARRERRVVALKIILGSNISTAIYIENISEDWRLKRVKCIIARELGKFFKDETPKKPARGCIQDGWMMKS